MSETENESDYVRTSWESFRNTEEGYLSQLGQELQSQQSESGRWEFTLAKLYFDRARCGERECERSQGTFAAPIKLWLKQIIWVRLSRAEA